MSQSEPRVEPTDTLLDAIDACMPVLTDLEPSRQMRWGVAYELEEELRKRGYALGRAVQDDGPPTVEALAQAMWDALSDNGILRIDADSPKELNDIAATIHRRLRATPALPEPEDARDGG